MARTLDQIVQEQLGGLMWLLCLRDAEIEQLKARVTQQQKVESDAKDARKPAKPE